MTEFEKKLKVLGVLDKFEANLEEASKMVQETGEGLLEGQSHAEFVKMLCEISPGYAISGAFRWSGTPEGFVFWRIVAELVTYSTEMLSPELLHVCCARYKALK